MDKSEGEYEIVCFHLSKARFLIQVPNMSHVIMIIIIKYGIKASAGVSVQNEYYG